LPSILGKIVSISALSDSTPFPRGVLRPPGRLEAGAPSTIEVAAVLPYRPAFCDALKIHVVLENDVLT